MQRLKTHAPSFFLLFLAIITVLVWYAIFYFSGRANLLVTFFDVGQGDAIFIEVPNGNQILIDGGPGDRILAKLGRELPFWDRSIDLLILTHPHADHLDGLLEVLKQYEAGMILESGVRHSIPEYQEWRTALQEKKVPVVTARAGQIIRAGEGVEITIFSPFENFSGKSLKNPHEANVVSRLEHGENSILFTGDAEKTLEYRLLFESLSSKFIVLKSKVFKVGHHGSKTSSSEEFLHAVSPEFAIIQVGRKNRYGHPHQEVLERLAVSGAQIRRTDLEGDMRLESDGAQYWFTD